MDLSGLIQAVQPRLLAEPGLACAWLFGSRARGQARPHSDVDLALLYSQDPPRTLEASGFLLADELAERVGLPVQVIIANHAAPDLLSRVLRDGILIVDLDKPRRLQFEVLTRNRWWDLQPVLEKIRRGTSSVHG
jgi:predicted nucleotidyltransferase